MLVSAEAAWAAADARRACRPSARIGPARPGHPRKGAAERDLSVQLSGWMLMEAAFLVGTAVDRTDLG